MSDRRQRELIQNRRVEWLAGLAPLQNARVASKDWAIIADIVQVAIGANADIERRAGSNAQNRREAQPAQRLRQIERSGQSESVTTILKAAGYLTAEIAGYERIRRVH